MMALTSAARCARAGRTTVRPVPARSTAPTITPPSSSIRMDTGSKRIRWVVVTLNHFQAGQTYSNEAFANMKALLLNLFPLVARDMTAAEKDRINNLKMISWLADPQASSEYSPEGRWRPVASATAIAET
jgi:hypothetical protein